MNAENTKKLFDRFTFFHPEKSPKEALMCFGFECGDGWFDIIWELCEKIEKELDDLPENEKNSFEVFQVKEKFGGLRFYTDWETNEIGDLINEAENKSYETCEVCGKPGKPNGGGWIRTLCEDCKGEK